MFGKMLCGFAHEACQGNNSKARSSENRDIWPMQEVCNER